MPTTILSLPVELRLAIYSDLLVEPGHITIETTSTADGAGHYHAPLPVPAVRQKKHTGILYVNRTIHAEAAIVLYSCNHLQLRETRRHPARQGQTRRHVQVLPRRRGGGQRPVGEDAVHRVSGPRDLPAEGAVDTRPDHRGGDQARLGRVPLRRAGPGGRDRGRPGRQRHGGHDCRGAGRGPLLRYQGVRRPAAARIGLAPRGEVSVSPAPGAADEGVEGVRQAVPAARGDVGPLGVAERGGGAARARMCRRQGQARPVEAVLPRGRGPPHGRGRGGGRRRECGRGRGCGRAGSEPVVRHRDDGHVREDRSWEMDGHVG
ncbi:hypothetical protein GE09DRAFT_1083688 [Coniochaeta sp. 2T2.1]|nr:hypothetical protein GE09DRAFT_1083688 [Coniochaeta sp. 2T2.1]